jgi:HK97 family phage prohead protease
VEHEQLITALDLQREIRSATFQPIDVADDGSWFEGYAAVFDEDASIELPDGTIVSESVNRGAFRKALATADYGIPMLYHHLDTHPPMAMWKPGNEGTLRLEEDARGFRTRADVARGYIGDVVRELVKRGDIPGMSWGFVAGRGNSKIERRSGGIHRTLLGFKRILDVSPTWDPTYRGTEAAFRSRLMGGTLLPGEQLPVVGESPQDDEDGQPGGDEETPPEGDEPKPEDEDADGVTDEPEQRSVAARMRALQLYIYETGGSERVDQA